jgi:parallel beta-helix repeat protein
MKSDPVQITRRAAMAALFGSLSACGGGGDAASPASVPPPSPPPPPPPPPPSGWYIDPSQGSDAADGRSPAAARLTLPPLAAGDRVFFRRGTTTVFASEFVPAVADLQFDAYTAAGDAADAPPPVWTLTGAGMYVLRTGGHEGHVFRHLRFEARNGETLRPAVRLEVVRPLARGCVFEDCEFAGDDGALVGVIRAACEGLAFRRCSFTAHRAQSFAFGATGCVFVAASVGSAPFDVVGMVWEDNRIESPAGPGMLLRSGSPTDDNVASFSGRFVDADFRRNRFERCGGHGVFLVCGFHDAVTVDGAGAHYGWDGLRFEDNVVADNASSGASIGPNLKDTRRTTLIQRNVVRNNGRLKGTTGGLQLNGLRHALVQDNECHDNWTTARFDGVNLFMDVIGPSSWEMATAGAVGCVVRRNRCSGARGAGGRSYEDWLAEQGTPNSSNAPSSGIRVYFGRGNQVYANLLRDNGSGIACDKSADNLVFNNTAIGCTMAFYDGVGLGTRGNRFFNNVSVGCDWDFHGLELEGWTPAEATTATVALSATRGTRVRVEGDAQFAAVHGGRGAPNFCIREAADTDGSLGLAVMSAKLSDSEVQVHVLRPFSSTRFDAGALVVGAMEAYRPGMLDHNGRHGARLGSVRALQPGPADIVEDPLLGDDFRPLPASPLVGRGAVLPAPLLEQHTDLHGVPFATPPTPGALVE